MLFTNYSQLKYYNFCDVISKYNLKSPLHIPTCYKILTQCANNKKISNFIIILPLLLFFYIIFFKLPKIYCKKKNQIQSGKMLNLDENELQNRSKKVLKVILFCSFKKAQLYPFLHNLFLRDWHGTTFLHIKNYNKKTFCGSVILPPTVFFFDTRLRNLSFKKYIFFLKFFFTYKNVKTQTFYNKSYFIQNFLYFWSLNI